MSAHHKPWHHQSKLGTAIYSLILATIITVVGFSFLYFGAHLDKNFQSKSIAKKTPVENVGLPVRLKIPVIGVDAKVQSVGLTNSGRMGIPTNFTDVAWYNLNPRPGQSGSAVIDGHLDNARDANAVFARLNELKSGDEIFVVDERGLELKFVVKSSAVYSDSYAPLSTIFDKSGNIAKLNLITCDGAWDQQAKNYDKRLVVYTELSN